MSSNSETPLEREVWNTSSELNVYAVHTLFTMMAFTSSEVNTFCRTNTTQPTVLCTSIGFNFPNIYYEFSEAE